MKVIDLLNKIANGEEAPKLIKYKSNIYEFANDNYYILNCYDEIASYCLLNNYVGILNDEVEIINDTLKKIEPTKIEVMSIKDTLKKIEPTKIEVIPIGDTLKKIEPIHRVGCSMKVNFCGEETFLPTNNLQTELYNRQN